MSTDAGASSVVEASEIALHRHRPFALYWLSRVSSTVALQMQAVAVSWQMYELTNNPLDLGLVGLFHFMPAALLVLVAGHVADRYDRRQVVRLCQFAAGIASATLAAGTIAGWISREMILGLVLVVGAARTFEATTMQTVVPSVVPLPLLARATAASSSATQVAVIGGPAVGGLLFAVSPILVYVLCASLYIFAGILVGLIRIVRAPVAREPISVKAMFAGFAFIRHNPIVLGAISLDMFAVLLGGATALLPVYARDILGAGPWALGLLRASPGLGALTAAAVMTRWPLRRHIGRLMFSAIGVFGVAIVAFSFSRSIVLSMAILAMLGAADMVGVVIRMTLVQLETPDDMRGRVSAVNSLFVTASNQLGEFRAGVMAAWLGAVPAVMIGGFAAIAVVLVGTRAFGALYKVDNLDPARR